MKHLLPLALLCAIGIPALNAQTVTILDKQGVSHKFNTDYVQEITFSDKEVVEPMEFTTLTAEAYGNGNAELDFRGDGLLLYTLTCTAPPRLSILRPVYMMWPLLVLKCISRPTPPTLMCMRRPFRPLS